MASSDRFAVVAGSSISGLMAAIKLKSTGFAVTLLERTPFDAFKDQGAGLGIRQEVVTFVDEHSPPGVELKAFTSVVDSIILENDGTEASRLKPVSQPMTTSWSVLVQALQACLGDTTACHYGAMLTGIQEESDGKLSVEYRQEGQIKQLNNVDLVVGADGAHSAVRRIMLGEDIPRQPAGYCLFRGIVPKSAVSKEVVDMHASVAVNACPNDGFCCISYSIPPKDPVEGPRIMWGTYMRLTEAETADYMTDADGYKHALTLPPGKMRVEKVEKWKASARARFAPQMVELIEKGSVPTIEVIADNMTPQACFRDGRVVLVGEAVAKLRPHVFAGTVQSAFHAERLADLVRGEISADVWARDVMDFSKTLYDTARVLGKALIYNPREKDSEVWEETYVILTKMADDLVKIQDRRNSRT